MLVLSVKQEGSVWIGDVKVKVLLIGPNRVQLGFEAPPDVRILRDALVKAKQTIAPPAEDQPCRSS